MCRCCVYECDAHAASIFIAMGIATPFIIMKVQDDILIEQRVVLLLNFLFHCTCPKPLVIVNNLSQTIPQGQGHWSDESKTKLKVLC